MAPIFENYQDVLEASKLLYIHPETIKRLIREGKLPATKFSNKWLIEREHLLSFAKTYKRQKRRRTD
jgi:excisionase family DNA binding protein